MKFAVCHSPEPAEEVARKLTAEGVTALETWHTFFENNDEKAIESTAKTLRDAGIRLFSAHAPFGEDFNLSSLDEEKRKATVESLKTLLEKVRLWGASVLVIHPGSHGNEKDIVSMENILPKSLEVLVKAAEKTGVKLGLENMPPSYAGCMSSHLREIVERFSSPYLGICFDTGHAHFSGEGVKDAFETLQDLIVSMHIHDNDGTRDMHLQPAYGTIDWLEFSDCLRESGFNDPITIEAVSWQDVPFSLMIKEVTALLEGKQAVVDLNGKDAQAVCPECRRYIFTTEGVPFCKCT